MTEKEALKIMKRAKAVVTDSHIVHVQRHGNAYVSESALYPHPAVVSRVCLALAKHFLNYKVDVVLGPIIGGAILSQWVGYHLGRLGGKEVKSVYAESNKDNDGFFIGRGYDQYVVGKNVLIVDDLIATGQTAKKVIRLTRSIGGNVVGMGVLINRGGFTKVDLDNIPELFELVTIKWKSWVESECPLCAKGQPVNPDVGAGHEFISQTYKRK